MTAEEIATTLAARFEEYRGVAYQDGGGVWTVGYGTIQLDGRPVRPGDTLSPERALALLQARVNKDASAIRKAARRDSTQNQLAALIDLAYNVGLGGVLGSTAMRRHNAGDRFGAVQGILMWTKDNGKDVPGLLKRRCAEGELYLS